MPCSAVEGYFGIARKAENVGAISRSRLPVRNKEDFIFDLIIADLYTSGSGVIALGNREVTMSTLDWITIEGFKSIKSVEELEIRPINVLIGANGAGKSNFLEVFSFLNAIRLGGLRDYVMRAGGADKILHFGSKVTQYLSIGTSFENEKREYNIVLAPDDADRMFPSSEGVRTSVKQEQIFDGFDSTDYGISGRGGEAGIYNSKDKSSAIPRVREHLLQWRVYHFHDTSASSPIKKTVALNNNRFLRHDGSNLAAFLYYLREVHGRAYDMVRRTMRLGCAILRRLCP